RPLQRAPGKRGRGSPERPAPVHLVDMNLSRSSFQSHGEPLAEGEQDKRPRSRSNDRLERTINAELDQELSPRGPARNQEDEIPQPQPYSDEACVHQHIVGKEDRPPPSRGVSHNGIREGSSAEPGRRERVSGEAHQKSRQRTSPRTTPHREYDQTKEQE